MKIDAITAKINIIRTPHGEDFNIPEGDVDSITLFSISTIEASITSWGVPKDSNIPTVASIVKSFMTSGRPGSITVYNKILKTIPIAYETRKARKENFRDSLYERKPPQRFL